MTFLKALVFSGLLSVGIVAAGADVYPNKPIRMVVPSAPGGVTDILARIFAQELTNVLGQSVVADNVSGAGSLIGAAAVARAAPDGYTLMLSAASNFGLGAPKVPYHPTNDFTHISQIAVVPSVVVVPASSPVKNIQELIAFAKNAKGDVFYGTGGIGTSVDVAAALFNDVAKVNFKRVAYRGSGPALLDLVAGRVDVMFDNLPSSLPQIKSGALRAIAVTPPERVDALPGVPTVKESGLPSYSFTAWFGIAGPKGMPQSVVEQLNKAIQVASTSPRLKEAALAQGAVIVTSSPDQFKAFVSADYDRTKGLKLSE